MSWTRIPDTPPKLHGMDNQRGAGALWKGDGTRKSLGIVTLSFRQNSS